MQVHDGHDVDPLTVDAIQETIRELRHEDAPESAAKRCPGERELGESFVHALNGGDEVEPEAGCFALVELSGRNEFVLRFG